MKSTRFVAFYSFKGGVGRSMTLANVAYHLAKSGKRVLIIDFDLEAPGQAYNALFYGQNISRGVLELFGSFVEASKAEIVPQFLDDLRLSGYYSYSSLPSESEVVPSEGSIALLPAGNFEDPAYEKRLSTFDWNEFYALKGRAFIELLKERISADGFDFVLLDSRTGLTDAFFVTALDFADTVVLMSSLNRQNVAGIKRVHRLLHTPKAIELYGARTILLVASPVPDVSLDDMRRRQNEIHVEWPDGPPFDVFIPYAAELALTERLLSYEADRLGQTNAYAVQCAELTRKIVEQETARDSLQEVKPTNPFSIVRRDYISEEDLVRYYVDPGGVVVSALHEFPPVIVAGARGSGKTTLASIFSFDVWMVGARAENAQGHGAIPEQIGLYFRIDADILRGFEPVDSNRKLYEQLFNQYLDLVIIQKAVKVLEKFSPLKDWLDVRRLYGRMYAQFGIRPSETECTSADFVDFVEQQLTLVALILNNPSKQFDELTYVQPNALLKILAYEVSNSVLFQGRYFAILIDEFENFIEFQQRVVNTRLKQTKREDNVTWRLFARSGIFLSAETLAPSQRIEETHDFRSYSLDEISFDTFETQVLRVASRHLELNPFFRAVGLTDITQLLSSVSDEEEALALKMSGRKMRPLIDWVKKTFANNADDIVAYIESEGNYLRAATAVVVMNQGAGGARGKHPKAVIESFERDDSIARDWYSNYKRGALFWLCTLYRTPKLYAGASALLGLSGRNVRYFLDFCNRVVAQWLAFVETRDALSCLPIAPSIQEQAIRSQARDYQENVQRTDKSARQLYQLIERLGRVFEAAHKSPRQSEPEINHFACRETDTLSESERLLLDRYLRDAVYEDVLKQLPGTKQKNLRSARLDAWQLASRFAPLFDLSTRRKKSLDLTDRELLTLFSGSDADWGQVFNRFNRRFNSDLALDGVVAIDSNFESAPQDRLF